MLELLPSRLDSTRCVVLPHNEHMRQKQVRCHLLKRQRSVRCYPPTRDYDKKQRHKDFKEKGLKPGKRTKEVEPGNDDCGDDLTGLGNVQMYWSDVCNEDIDTDDDADTYWETPTEPTDTNTPTLYNSCTLRYSSDMYADLLELRTNDNTISELAFRNELVSGGTASPHTTQPTNSTHIQNPVTRYLDTCFGHSYSPEKYTFSRSVQV